MDSASGEVSGSWKALEQFQKRTRTYLAVRQSADLSARGRALVEKTRRRGGAMLVTTTHSVVKARKPDGGGLGTHSLVTST